jgi:hypothetical protein
MIGLVEDSRNNTAVLQLLNTVSYSTTNRSEMVDANLSECERSKFVFVQSSLSARCYYSELKSSLRSNSENQVQLKYGFRVLLIIHQTIKPVSIFQNKQLFSMLFCKQSKLKETVSTRSLSTTTGTGPFMDTKQNGEIMSFQNNIKLLQLAVELEPNAIYYVKSNRLC